MELGGWRQAAEAGGWLEAGGWEAGGWRHVAGGLKREEQTDLAQKSPPSATKHEAPQAKDLRPRAAPTKAEEAGGWRQ